jgi:hypothetical protein
MEGDGGAGATQQGQPLTRSAGNFNRANVIGGDLLYIVFVFEDRSVHLVARMRVRRIWEREEYDRVHPNNQIWPAPQVAEGQEGTPMVFWRPIPAPILRCMGFLSVDLITNDGTLTGDGHTQPFQGVHRLSAESARLLDELIDDHEWEGR